MAYDGQQSSRHHHSRTSTIDAWTDEFLYSRAAIPAMNASLFPHHRYLEQTVLQYLLREDSQVQLRETDEDKAKVGGVQRKRKRKIGKVKLVCEGKVLIAFDDNTEFVDLEQLELMQPDVKENDEEFDELLRLFKEDRSTLKLALMDTIRVGDIFELRDRHSLRVHVVEIAACHNGFVHVRRADDSTEFVHITSDRCNAIGWTQRQLEQDVKYFYEGGEELFRGRRAAPKWLFNYVVLEQHDFAGGALLEALDPSNKVLFRPAVVTHVINRHYFNIRLLCDLTESAKLEQAPKIEFCHRNSTEIRSLGWCSRNNVRLSYPTGTTYYAEVKELVKRKMPTLNVDARSVSNIGPPMIDEKLETIRYCEFMLPSVLSPDKPPVFAPAAIVRASKNIVSLKLENVDRCLPPQVHAVNSSLLFPWGFARQAGFELSIIPTLAGVLKFDLSPAFTKQRNYIFREHRKRFMISSWLKPGIWLPTIYFNKLCFTGPFLNPVETRLMPLFFGPGALPVLLVEIIRRIAQCSIRMARFVELVEAKKTTLLPTVHISVIRNIKNGSKNFNFNVEACENTEQFCGWLRTFLLRLDACPNLFSIEQKRDVCPYGCRDVAALPYMQPQFPPAPMSANGAGNAGSAAKLLVCRPRVLRSRVLSGVGSGSAENNDTHSAAYLPSGDQEKKTLKRFSPIMSTRSPIKMRQATRRPFGSDSMTSNNNNNNNNNNTNFILDSKVNGSPVHSSDDTSHQGNNGSTATVLTTNIVPLKMPPCKSDAASAIVSDRVMMQVQPADDDGDVISAYVIPSPAASKSIKKANGIQLVHNTPEKLPSPLSNPTLFLTTTMSPPTSNMRIKYCCPAIDSNPIHWSCEKLSAWIRSADDNFEWVAQKFLEEEVDGEAVMMFTLNTLINLGMKVGPAVKVNALIEELKKEAVKKIGNQ